MASVVEICNLALSHLGVRAIQSLTENSKQAAACNLQYEPTRDAVLRDHAWGFAKKRLVLALLDATFSGWDYAYAYPTDCIMAHDIYNNDGSVSGSVWDPETGTYYTGGKVDFETSISDDLSQQMILTNKEDAELLYTARVTTPTLFDPMFVDALSYALATKLTQPLKADKVLKKEVTEQYGFSLARAEARSANEENKRPDSDMGSFVNAR